MNCPITGEVFCKCKSDSLQTYQTRPKDTLRKLFTDHAIYTKFYTVAALDSRPETAVILDRLLENQEDIGKYLGQFIGTGGGEAVTHLLTEHIQLAGAAIDKLKKGEDLTHSVEALFENNTRVAQGLAGLSHGALEEELVEAEFKHHNQYVLDIATLHKKKRYREEFETYDAYYVHMLSFSDLICSGLVD